MLTASILKIYVPWQGTILKLPHDDIEISKYVGVYVYYIKRYSCDTYGRNITCEFVGSNKNKR